MRGGSLKYLTREGFRNAWVNRLMSVASIAVLMSCLIIIGSAVMVFANISVVLNKIEEQNVVMVFVKENADQAVVEQIGNEIAKISNVKEVVFISKEESFANQLQSLGDDAALLENIIENPLPDSYKVVLEDLELYGETVSTLKNIENVGSVRENGDLAKQLTGIRNAITLISIGIITMLFLVAFFIISNTIRITMFSRRLEISIMKAVGATNWFIRWPFMIEGIFLGIVASVMALLTVFGIYEAVIGSFTNMLGMLGGSPVDFMDYIWYMLAAFVAVGIVTGAGGSLVSMGKYLKEKGCVVCED